MHMHQREGISSHYFVKISYNNIMDNKKNYLKHGHKQIKICISGAAETGHCGVDALDKAKLLGKEIAKSGAVLVMGATGGFPLWVAMGAKEAGGMCIGFSPAASEREHVEIYKLPLDYMDLVIYTGFGYSGRDLLLTRSADAVICGCGRIGTIHEFTVAYDDEKPIGIYEGPWETANELKEIALKSHRVNNKIVSSDDPVKLVQDLLAMINKEKVPEFKL